MRKYSPLIGLLAVITAMVIFQIGTLNADASSVTTSSQYNQINRSATVGGPLMAPMDARLAKDSGEDKAVGESEKKEDKPDLKTVDWYKTASAKKDDGNVEAEEEGEGEGDEEGADDKEGGFDRLWDVVLNG